MTTKVELVRGALRELPRHVPPAPGTVLVVDEGAVDALRPPLEPYEQVIRLPGGEQVKTWDRLGSLLVQLDRLDRDGLVVALGGGALTDLAGLAASLHRRGTPWMAVPTTLVGQVDAALGGKTAVNLGGGKNTVGTFHPPTRVLVDPAALATLPRRELAAGLAEVLKTALLSGEELLLRVERLDPADELDGIIGECLRFKQCIVEQDLRDHGARRQLNLGHTFGHAFEALSIRGPAPLLHGEAVGLGLLCAARLAGVLEERVRAALLRFGLPVTLDVDPRAVLDEMRRDKKRGGGRMVLVLPVAPGEVALRALPSEAPLLAALEAVRA